MSSAPWRDQPHVVEQLDVAVALFDRRAEADGRVADDAGMLLDDGPERGGVLLGRRSASTTRSGAWRVDDRAARVDARERVLGVVLDGRGHVGLRRGLVTPLSATSMITGLLMASSVA